MTSTMAAIRDRIEVLVTELVPAQLAGDRFRHSRDEGSGEFIQLIEANMAGGFRRFQARTDGDDEAPEWSAVDQTLESARFIVTVAYPHNQRYGENGSADRDAVIEADWRKIDFVIGVHGAGNFSGGHDCTPLGASKRTERRATCDFLVVTMECTYYVDVDG